MHKNVSTRFLFLAALITMAAGLLSCAKPVAQTKTQAPGAEPAPGKVIPPSPTLGATPPAGGIVLFDGTNFDQWQQMAPFTGFVNLAILVGGGNCVAYLRSELVTHTQHSGILELGSDDGLKVWLNGQLIHTANVGRGLKPGEDKLNITLKSGSNILLLKVSNYSGPWSACARLADSNDKPLAGICEKDAGPAERNNGFLTYWSISPAYTQEGKSFTELLDIPFAPEIPGQENTVAWKTVDTDKANRDSVLWKLVDGTMEVTPFSGSIITKKKFTDFKLHIEFRTPYEPGALGQARGNSGVYLQGRYEIQVLDSYGMPGLDNDCGGIYKVAAPLVNMCAPPMQWQTYDITFHAPRFDNAGAKTRNARVTVLHNGVVIHDNLEIPGPTGGASDNNESQPGGIYLQDHGDRVQFRNIWLVKL